MNSRLYLSLMITLGIFTVSGQARAAIDKQVTDLIKKVDLAAAPFAEAKTSTIGDLEPAQGIAKISVLQSNLNQALANLEREVEADYGKLTYQQHKSLVIFLHDSVAPAADVAAYSIPWNMSDSFQVFSDAINYARGGSTQTQNARNGGIQICKMAKTLAAQL